MKTLLLIFAIVVLILALIPKSKPYTHKEWDEQCKKDFKKYGPVPEDKD